MGAPTPPLIVQGFGAGAGAGFITNPIPVASQIGITPGAASYADGFPPLTMTPPGSGGKNPFGQDENGILLALSANIAALTGGQFWPFDATWAAANGGYALGAVVSILGGYGFWINKVSGNLNNPDTTAAATSGWARLIAYGNETLGGLTNANVTLTADQAAPPNIIFEGTLTGNVQIIFPTWTNQWAVTNLTTGAFSLTCKTASGTGVIIAQGTQPSLIIGDGTNIQALYQPATSGVGWFQLPGGQIFQYGLVANGGAGPTAVTFPIRFPTACLSLVSQNVNVQGTITQASVTATGFVSTNGAVGSSTYWQAIGN